MDEKFYTAIHDCVNATSECIRAITEVQKVHDKERDKDRKSSERKTYAVCITVLLFFLLWFNCSMTIDKRDINRNLNTYTNINRSLMEGGER